MVYFLLEVSKVLSMQETCQCFTLHCPCHFSWSPEASLACPPEALCLLTQSSCTWPALGWLHLALRCHLSLSFPHSETQLCAMVLRMLGMQEGVTAAPAHGVVGRWSGNSSPEDTTHIRDFACRLSHALQYGLLAALRTLFAGSVGNGSVVAEKHGCPVWWQSKGCPCTRPRAGGCWMGLGPVSLRRKEPPEGLYSWNARYEEGEMGKQTARE